MPKLPEILKQGESARLFPVLADTNREQRLTSIFLSLLPKIPALSAVILSTAGLRVGKRTTIQAYTEVVLKSLADTKDRPDGFLLVSTGITTWSALVETKIGKSKLKSDQVQRYVEMASANGVDAVVTISNEFVARADHSPVIVPRNLLRRTRLLHWSWMWIATQCEILIHNKVVEDDEQAFLLNEFLRLLKHPATGVERFTQMGTTWRNLVQSVANKEHLKKNSPIVEEGVACWLEEERDLCLQLARHIGQPVETVIERKLQLDPLVRLKAGVSRLTEQHSLLSKYRIPDCAGDIEVCADLTRKTITASMRIKAPLDRKSTRARINWLLRMLKNDDPRIIVRAHWLGRTPATQETLQLLRENPDAIQTENKSSAPIAFEIQLVEGTGKRFSGRRTFIEDLERIVPDFYDLVGMHLREWQPTPPRPVKTTINEEQDQEQNLTTAEVEDAS